MNRLRRWTASLVASFDSIINQVENHDAVVGAAIKEMQDAGVRARVHLGRVKQDGQAMRKRIVELHESQEQWQKRAVEAAALDEAKALECVRRAKRAEKELAELETQERDHARLEKQLGDDLGAVDRKIAQLKQQKNILRTRQSRAEAVRAISNDDSTLVSEIGDIFERWETKVSTYEIEAEFTAPADDLEDEFVSKEEELELKASLQELMKGKQ